MHTHAQTSMYTHVHTQYTPKSRTRTKHNNLSLKSLAHPTKAPPTPHQQSPHLHTSVVPISISIQQHIGVYNAGLVGIKVGPRRRLKTRHSIDHTFQYVPGGGRGLIPPPTHCPTTVGRPTGCVALSCGGS